VSEPFRFLLRVRYAECDAQKIVFNARWGDYVDVAVTEYARTIWGSIDGSPHGIDYHLVRQVLEWRAPARFDDVLEARITCARIGTTSFTLVTEFRRRGTEPVLVTAETVYVVIDPATATKRPLPDAHRAALERGAPDVLVNHAGAP
jgi:acyl-CoA thioester hydrolase